MDNDPEDELGVKTADGPHCCWKDAQIKELEAHVKVLVSSARGSAGVLHQNYELLNAQDARIKKIEEARDTFERDAVKAHEDLSHAVRECRGLEDLLQRAAVALPVGELRDEIRETVALAGEEENGG